MKIFIGTSGYSYRDWKGKFYPLESAEADFLRYYAEHFNSVEINMTFYRTPFVNVVKSWCAKTPSDFRFSCKGPRYITHIQRLCTNDESLTKFFESLSYLGEKLLVILWQLPASLKRDMPLLKDFLSLLYQNQRAKNLLHCFEFRNKSWFRDQVFSTLEAYHTGFCWYDAPEKKFPAVPIVTTGSMIYLRFHGKKQLYKYNYSVDELQPWIDRISSQVGVRFCFCFFNNDYNANAIFNAKQFKGLLLERCK